MSFVSVLMAVHNGRWYIMRALESLENQTFKNFEIILVDDGSTDDTIDIVESYKQKSDLNIKITKIYENVGHQIALNIAYLLSKGKYIIRLDHDDQLLANALKYLTNIKSDIIYGNYIEIHKYGRKHVLPKNLLESIGCGVSIRKDFINTIGGLISHDIGIFIEYDLYIRAIENNAHITKIDKDIYLYHKEHETNMTTNIKKTTESIDLLKKKWGEKWTKQIRPY